MNNQLTPAQQELLDFLSPVELPGIYANLKQVFRAVAFESDLIENKDAKNQLFTIWYLTELIGNMQKGC